MQLSTSFLLLNILSQKFHQSSVCSSSIRFLNPFFNANVWLHVTHTDLFFWWLWFPKLHQNHLCIIYLKIFVILQTNITPYSFFMGVLEAVFYWSSSSSPMSHFSFGCVRSTCCNLILIFNGLFFFHFYSVEDFFHVV